MDEKKIEEFVNEVNQKSVSTKILYDGKIIKGIKLFYYPKKEISLLSDFYDNVFIDGWDDYSTQFLFDTKTFRNIIEELNVNNVVNINCKGAKFYAKSNHDSYYTYNDYRNENVEIGIVNGSIRLEKSLSYNLSIIDLDITKSWNNNSISCCNDNIIEKMLIDYIKK